MSAPIVELQLDGLAGPTHHFGGLATGNVASAASAESRSNPRAAAHQGVAKMRAVVDAGVPVGLLPPRERPSLELLRAVGFTGPDDQVLAAAAKDAPQLLRASSSASAMWTANAATVTPSRDAHDGRVHLTPANLVSHVHRALEARETTELLARVFLDRDRFALHAPLPSTATLSDEGAANHTRLAASDTTEGVSLFVWGSNDDAPHARRFTGRQAEAASRAVARQHGVRRVAFARQHPEAVDAGAFHHDVVGVGNGDRLLMHSRSLLDTEAVVEALSEHVTGLRVDLVGDDRLTLDEAVGTYLFNSQLLSTARGEVLVADRRAVEHPRAGGVIAEWRERHLIDLVVPVDLDESMRNGGGPACLRLRVPLTPDELASVDAGFLLDHGRLDALDEWIDRHYREVLVPADLADPRLLAEVRDALDALTTLLGTGPLYAFQR